MSLTFDYRTTRIKDLQVVTTKNQAGKTLVASVNLNDEPLVPTDRFWSSLHMRFGFTSNIFRYFSHAEVFTRISEVAGDDQIRLCIQRDESGPGQLLAVTNPRQAVMQHQDLMALLGKYGGEEVKYSRGIVSSQHNPRNTSTFQVAGDGFKNKFVLDTPIDGYGRPSVYLSLLRLLCANGAIGFSAAFRSELNVGKGDDGVFFALTRVLEGFNNEDGFAALRQRFESGARSWASVNETNKLYKLLARLHNLGQVKKNGTMKFTGSDGASETTGSPLFKAFHSMTGDLAQVYGLANMDALSVKRQRTLPTACKVYELLNFASEVATHQANEVGARSVQAYIGDLISNEYDLEGTADHFSNWRDFFISSDATASTLAGMNRRS
jgi:hypothetical protein